MTELNPTIEPDTERKPPRLTKSRREAAQLLRNQMKLGAAIREQRIRDMHGLDQARAEKQEWVGRTSELLGLLFGGPEVADEVNDWVGPILPEYAELGMFIDLFDGEMKHRISRLYGVLKLIDTLPEPTSAPAHQQQPSARQSPRNQDMSTKTLHPISATSAATTSHASQRPNSSASHSGLLLSRVSDDAPKQAVGEFLDKLGLKLTSIDMPVVSALGDHPQAGFAIVLVESPDAGGAGDGEFLFNLGCLVGKLGGERVCVLQRNPHDTAGVDRFGVRAISLDPTDGWQLQLARHLKAGGVGIDLNKLV